MKTKITVSYYLFTFTLIFIYSISVHSQNISTKENHADTFKNTLTLQHTTIVVSNFSESRKFYLDLLKLEEIKQEFLPKNQMFISAGENLELHVGEVPGVEIKPSNFNHFALTSNNFDEFLEYLKESGIVYKSLGGEKEYYIQRRPDGVRQTFIQDPDGYWIEINDKTQ